MHDDLDLAMRARMAEEDAQRFRTALAEALFDGRAPSDDCLIKFAAQRIEHSRRIAPDNPLGRIAGPLDITSESAVATLRHVRADLRQMGTEKADRLALILGDLDPAQPDQQDGDE